MRQFVKSVRKQRKARFMNTDFKLKFSITPDEDSAEIALKLVEMYCNANGKRIEDNIVSHESNEIRLNYNDKDFGCEDCDPQIPRNYVCYNNSGKEKVMNFCPTCGRRVRY